MDFELSDEQRAFQQAAREFAATPAGRWGLRHVPQPLPRGVVLGIVELVAVYPAEELIGDGAQMEFRFAQSGEFAGQLPFGDFSPGRFVWLLKNARPFAAPMPAKGAQQLWEWNPELP